MIANTLQKAAPAEALTVLHHHRMICQQCQTAEQPSEFEKTLWTENVGGTFTCPKCLKKKHVGIYGIPTSRRAEYDEQWNDFVDEMRSSRDADFDDYLFESDKKLQLQINDLQTKLDAAKLEHGQLLEEAKELTDMYKWISRKRLTEIEYYQSIDEMFKADDIDEIAGHDADNITSDLNESV